MIAQNALLKGTAKKAGLIPACGYIRMSTDEQKDSPARQRAEIERLAKQWGCYIVDWYEDHGKTGTESRKRKSFQRMLVDAKAGKFQAILIYEPSRLSREDPFDVFEHYRTLRDASVRVISCMKGEMDLHSLGGQISALVEAHQSADEVKKFAHRSMSGKREKVSKRLRVEGVRLFAYDRQFFNERGEVVATASYREKYRKPNKDWTMKLIPTSDSQAIWAVRFIFEKFAEGWPTAKIRRELTSRSLRTTLGKLWSHTTIISILQNPSYCGDTVIGRFANGKYERICQDGEIIIQRDTHPGLVPRELFERVQSILAIRKPCKRRKRHPGFLLTGLLRCECCGYLVYGDDKRRNTTKQYKCGINWKMAAKVCNSPVHVRANIVEDLVLRLITTAIVGCESEIAKAGERRKLAGMAEGKLQSKLGDVRKRLEKAKRNLAFADSQEDFRIVSKAITEAEAEESTILGQLEALGHRKRIAPEMEAALFKLRKLTATDRQAILADEVKVTALAQGLASVVESIHIGRSWSNQQAGHKLTRVRVVFHASSGLSEINHEELDAKPIVRWLPVRDYLLSIGRPATTKEVIAALGIEGPTAGDTVRNWVATGIRKGWIRKVVRGQWEIMPKNLRPKSYTPKTNGKRPTVAW